MAIAETRELLRPRTARSKRGSLRTLAELQGVRMTGAQITCAALEADAAAARIEVRRMWYAQDLGFAMSALPVGFGLPRKRW